MQNVGAIIGLLVFVSAVHAVTRARFLVLVGLLQLSYFREEHTSVISFVTSSSRQFGSRHPDNFPLCYLGNSGTSHRVEHWQRETPRAGAPSLKQFPHVEDGTLSTHLRQ